MKYLLTLLIFCSTLVFAGDSLVFEQLPNENRIIGEELVDVIVVFSTDKYDLDTCANSAYEKGFYVAQRKDNGKLIFYCGTNMKHGDSFTMVVEKGI